MKTQLPKLRSLFAWAWAFVVLLALSLWLVPASRAATTITVNSTLDQAASDGKCTLREAIIAANRDQRSGTRAGECPAGNGSDTIIVPAGTYILTRNDNGNENAAVTGDLDITASLVISPTGPVTISVNAAYTDRIFHIISGDVTLKGLTIAGGHSTRDGGGIYNQANLTLSQTTLAATDSTGQGAGIYNAGTLSLLNSTLSGNRARGAGGALYQASGSSRLNNVTIAFNVADSDANGSGDGGGLRVAGGTLSIQNSLMAGNSDASASTKHPDCSGNVTSNGYNLVQNAAGCALSGSTTGNLIGVDPLLGPLQANGGSTRTHALLAGSPAVDAGNPAAPGSQPAACLPVDQRGKQRPDGAACDIGAFESSPPPSAPVIIRAVVQASATQIDGRVVGPPGASLTVTVIASETCGPAGPGSPQTQLGAFVVVVDATGNGIFQAQVAQAPAGRFVTARVTAPDGGQSVYADCVRVSAGNDSWTNALPVSLGGSPQSASLDGYLDQAGQSRWFKFSSQPNARAVVLLTNLPANYDLTVYKDIRQTLQSLNGQALNSQQDLAQLGAEFAPDAFSPDAFSPDAFSPDAFSPDAFSPDAFSPDAFSPDAFSPDAFSPDAFSPDAFSPDAFSPDAFSPDAFSPDAFSPDAFSPDAFSPDAFSPDAFSGAQLRSLIAVSAFEGTAGEGVALHTWDNTGDFYIRVRGRNGAFDPQTAFRLQVSMSAGQCGAINASQLPATSLNAAAGNFRTVILVDSARLAQSAELDQRLIQLAARPEVAGVVVNVSQDARVAAANALADANPACPVAKNLVAEAIKSVVDRYRAQNPLAYVVLIGGDDVIPFFRHPDQAMLANEKNYVPPVRDNTASQASLRLGYFLSQDRYGSAISISVKGNDLPLPALAVGRLVETEADIMTMLDAYLSTAAGVVATPTSSLVTGYDFLEDSALAVRTQLEAGTGQPADSLIAPRHLSPQDPQAWSADDLRALLLGERHDLMYLAGHFSANSALAADYQTRLLAEEVAASPVNLNNSIIFSPGCHAAYNIVNGHGVANLTREPDWAQAFAAKGATLIAGTGYQYGDTDFIEYSERLYLEFSRQLRAGSGPVSVGQALVEAKQAYLAGTPLLRPIHEKALLEATLFGLPMLSVDMPAGRGGAGGPSSTVPSTNAYNSAPGAALGLSFAEVTLNPSLTEHTQPLDVVGNGSTVQASYLSGSNGVVSNPSEPVLPVELRDVTVANTTLRGIGFRGGSFTDLPERTPLTGAPAIEVRGVHTPFPSDVFFPVRMWAANYFDALADALGRTRLVVVPAQYRSTAPGASTSTLRRYDSLDFRLFYSNNLATFGGGSTPALAGPPVIARVDSAVGAGLVDFDIQVVGNPAAGIQEVWVTYSAVSGPLAGRWQSLDLVQDASDSTRWRGALDLAGTPAQDVRFIVQAVNGVGLVGLDTNQGAYHVPGGQAEPTDPTALVLLSPPGSGPYGTRITVSARLTHLGAPVAGQLVAFSVGAQTRVGFTDASGNASATLSLLGSPGSQTLRAAFAGNSEYIASSTSAPFTINRQNTQLTLQPASATVDENTSTQMTATLTDSTGRPLGHKTVFFVLSGPAGSYSAAVITDYAGRAALGVVPLPPGDYTVTVQFGGTINLPNGTLNMDDEHYNASQTVGALTVLPTNQPPQCSGAMASSVTLWPPNGAFMPITVLGVTDPDGDPVTITITGIRQDERVGSQPDGRGVGTSTAEVRSERDGNGNGRVYHIFFTASDDNGGTCNGEVLGAIATHDQAANLAEIDGGPLYDSTVRD